ncbi:hypothetical protein [Kitasatospora sp. NPDC093102]|uniref:hypothetical protein n=1 Tax=Kitasatospora sp. NPDC093102 TaxID=3155069 RepID=UPI00342CCAEA
MTTLNDQPTGLGPEFAVARVFDHVDPVAGPGFAPDHPRIEDLDVLGTVADYLKSGTEVLITPMLMEDVVDPGRGGVVPMNFRTDGRWIWTDTVTYYLEHHGLAPDPGLLSHVLDGDGERPSPDESTLERAANFILRPAETPEQEPVWAPGDGRLGH